MKCKIGFCYYYFSFSSCPSCLANRKLCTKNYTTQGMRQHGCSGCTNPQIFGISPYAPADFEASSAMCTRCFETQSSPGCTCTRRSKFLTHSPCVVHMVYSYNVLHMLLRQQLQLLKDQLISQKEILVKQIAQRLVYVHQRVGQMLRKKPIPQLDYILAFLQLAIRDSIDLRKITQTFDAVPNRIKSSTTSTFEESHVTLGMYFLTSDDVEFQMAKTSSMLKNAFRIYFFR